MNFWKRYPADYQRKTARLTLAQHGAYTLLLDELYTSEQPLSGREDELFRICRAMTKAEQEAVRMVVDLFFELGPDDRLHNKRASKELLEAAPAIEAARTNGKKGGRPRTQKEPTGFSEHNPNETQNEPRSKAPHSSDNSPSLRSGEARASRLPAGWSLPVEWAEWARAERPDLDPQKVAEKFADHWQAKPGKEGRKLDWLKTWRNWVRDERAPLQAVTGETAYQRSMRERANEIHPAIARKAPGSTQNPMDALDEITLTRIAG